MKNSLYGFSYTFRIFRGGSLVKEFKEQKNESEAFRWMCHNTPATVSKALRDGWKVEQINEQTKKVEIWR